MSYLNFISSMSLKESAALYGQADLVRLIRRILLRGRWQGDVSFATYQEGYPDA
ncbi:MAG: hypothetical protein PHX16_10070 [Syntrophaceticus sp.]|jgi:hypothetical protein|nr:hypothetical protein [Syntrophaceticus sp.]